MLVFALNEDIVKICFIIFSSSVTKCCTQHMVVVLPSRLPEIVAKASAPTFPPISHAVSRLPEILAKVSAPPTPRPISHAGEGFARDCAKKGGRGKYWFSNYWQKTNIATTKTPSSNINC